MTTYINFKGVEGVETVDEFHTRKDAKVALSEYQMQRNPGGSTTSARVALKSGVSPTNSS
jgi:proline racemase